MTSPQIIRISDGTVMRSYQNLVSGPAALKDQMLIKKIRRLAVLNFFWYILLFLFNQEFGAVICSEILVLAFILALFLYRGMLFIGKLSLSRYAKVVCSKRNVLYLTNLEQGAEVSQPSTLHRYWMMVFDIPPGKQLHIRGKINVHYQRYWSFTVYDEYGLPLPQYIFDENVCRTDVIKDKNGNDLEYSYDICMRAVGIPTETNSQHPGTTVFDIFSVKKGYALFRLVHPAEADIMVEKFSAPKTELINCDYLTYNTFGNGTKKKYFKYSF